MPEGKQDAATPPTPPTLVVLAAGVGRRFGGLKQFDAVGVSGELLMDYTVYDAARAGFVRAVFVIRPEMRETFEREVAPRYRGRVEAAWVEQRVEAVPAGFGTAAGRTKPWGTGQAVLSASGCVRGPFAVVNADDFYGRGALASLGAFLREQREAEGAATFAMVGYRLRDTLTAAGAVSRGICRCGEGGWLERIEEVHGLRPSGSDACIEENGLLRVVSGETLVSMNCWGFTPALMDALASAFGDFLREPGAMEREFYLPAAVNEMVRRGAARVRVLEGGGAWCGLTHGSDREEVRRFIERRVASGEYPRDLWS